MNISVIGGDLRIIRLIEMYEREEKIDNIYTYGLERYFEKGEENNSKIKVCNSLEETVKKSKYIISSMPFSKDKVTVNAPFSDKEIQIEDLFKQLLGKTFIAGGITKEYIDISIMNKINFIDLLENEKLTILNAIPTVEGTIKLAIEKREETIHESNVLICGYGRIGKILCEKFGSLGAIVYASARKETDLAWIREKRYFPLKYNELSDYLNRFDIVINTVPTIILKQEELSKLRKDVLIIDLASKPGGIDKEYAKKIGLNVITALGIPGKELPKTAGKYIKEVVDKIIKEE